MRGGGGYAKCKLYYEKQTSRLYNHGANNPPLHRFAGWLDSWRRQWTPNYFVDEVLVRLTHFDNEAVVMFLGCDRVEMQHWWGGKFKSIKEYTKPQLDFYAHQITIKETSRESCTYKKVKIDGKVQSVRDDDVKYYECVWDLAPITLTVFCRDITIEVV